MQNDFCNGPSYSSPTLISFFYIRGRLSCQKQILLKKHCRNSMQNNNNKQTKKQKIKQTKRILILS